MDLKDLDLIIESRTRAGQLLNSASRRPRWCISIGAPHQSKPSGFRKMPPGKVLRLEFDDVSRLSIRGLHTPPARTHIERLVGFCKRIDGGRVLIHCEAGISRSTASALVLLSMKLGHGMEDEAMRQVLQAAPQARPNLLVVRLADDYLGRSGAMISALRITAESE